LQETSSLEQEEKSEPSLEQFVQRDFDHWLLGSLENQKWHYF
jgi:hypothetical protein